MALVLPALLAERRNQMALGAVAVVALLLFGIAEISGGGGARGNGGNGDNGPPPLNVTWGPVTNLAKEGYEPGLAADSTGTLYYTAHKDQNDRASYEYLASWFLISRDNGASWYSPTDPFPLGAKWKAYVGDEGDIAVDARDYVYFVDTYLLDNHLHVWAQEDQWQYSEHIQKTTGLDDRPWITAQGQGILHYLGNNGQEVAGGRYWYYRSTNGGRTFTAGDPVPGNGWAEIDAERMGDHVYIVDESDIDTAADIRVWASADRGVTWDWSNPAIVGHRDGPGSSYPLVASGPNGVVWVLWNDITNGTENGTRIFVGLSTDYGKSWNASEITPFKMYSYYQSICVSPEGDLGVSFYGTPDVPVSNNSSWYLYSAIQRNADVSVLDLNFSKASKDPVFVGSRVNALGDLFESTFTPDHAINIGFELRTPDGKRWLQFVRGTLPDQ